MSETPAAGQGRNGGLRPVPDPTTLTTQLLEREVKGVRDYIDGEVKVLVQRLDGVDVATELRLDVISEVPAKIADATSHLQSLLEVEIRSQALLADERFKGIDKQFAERDTRSEREARDNKLAVDAAFAAQEKQAVAQQESNSLAIEKSEKATTETIKTNMELSVASAKALDSKLDSNTKSLDDKLAAHATSTSDKLDDLKERIGAIEQRQVGRVEHRTEERATITFGQGIIATIFAAVVLALGIYAAFRTTTHANAPAQTVTQTVEVPAATTPGP